MESTPRHSVSVAAVILDQAEDKVLLIRRRDNGNWEPPGGVLELDETFEDGLRREVREETGTEVRVDALTGVYKNMTRGVVALVFRCRALNKPEAESEEAAEVAWVRIDQVPHLMSPAYAIRVQDAMWHTPTTLRIHDGTDLIRFKSGHS